MIHEIPSPTGQMLPSTDNCTETIETLRDSIGSDLYDRIMQWNDSGAVAALVAKETRKNGLYIDGDAKSWDKEEMSPVSVLDLSKKLECEEELVCHDNKESSLLDKTCKQREGEKNPGFLVGDNSPKRGGGASLHKSMDMKAINVDCVNGLELLRDDLRASGRGDFPVQLLSTNATMNGDGSYHGRMFLCGGWPINQTEKPQQLSHVLESVMRNKLKGKPSDFGRFWKRITSKVSRKSEIQDVDSTGCSKTYK